MVKDLKFKSPIVKNYLVSFFKPRRQEATKFHKALHLIFFAFLRVFEP